MLCIFSNFRNWVLFKSLVGSNEYISSCQQQLIYFKTGYCRAAGKTEIDTACTNVKNNTNFIYTLW